MIDVKKNSILYLSMGMASLQAGATSCTEKPAADERPNIIYILMDDFGYGDAECYGQIKTETPNIDRLAAQGMLFTQHYTIAPVSAAARCGLMTGLHSGHMQIRGNDEMRSRGNVWSHEAMLADPYLEGQAPLKAGTVTLGNVMQDGGYRTACVGKWGLGYPGSEGAPNLQGFDFFFGYNCQRQAHTYYPPFMWKNDERVYLDNPDIIQPGTKLDPDADPYDEASYARFTQNVYSPDVMFDEMIGFIEDNRDTPFFLMWTSPIPHVALQAPERLVKYYVEKFGDEEPYIGKGGYYPTRYPHATYAAMITYIDEQIGLLENKLKELGIYDNTIIMFTSDNGPTFNGGSDSPWFNSGGLFKSEYGWGKCSVHEGGIRIPMIASWPAKIKEGVKTDHISYFADVMPTICDIAGIDYPDRTDGISFLPTLLGKDGKQKKHEYLYWEYPETGGWKAVRWGKWKAIIRNIQKGNDTMELYDLSTDIQELDDIADLHPDVVAQIRQFMAESHEKPENPRFDMQSITKTEEQ